MRLIPATDVHARWSWVRAGLKRIKAKSPCCTWLPEDIYHALYKGMAVLWLIVQEDGDEVGFCVLQKLESAYDRALFVWAIWCEPNSMTREYGEIIEQLQALAKKEGLDRVRMISDRDGWKATPFVPVSTIYEIEA